jgi:carbonic anhydrase
LRGGGRPPPAANKQYGLIDNWLVNIRDVVRLHETELLRIGDDKQRLRRLVELNVMEQVRNLAKTNIIQNALRGDNPPRLHGLVYDIADGVLKDLQVDDVTVINDLAHIYGTQAKPLIDSEHVPEEPTQEEESSHYDGPQHDPSQVATSELTEA